MDIDEALDIYQVEKNESDESFPRGWWLVTDGYGIIGAFPDESAACRYRLYMVNRLSNN